MLYFPLSRELYTKSTSLGARKTRILGSGYTVQPYSTSNPVRFPLTVANRGSVLCPSICAARSIPTFPNTAPARSAAAREEAGRRRFRGSRLHTCQLRRRPPCATEDELWNLLARGADSAPSRPVDRALLGAGLLAHVATANFCDHLPLYRQSQIYAREGVDLDRSTLARWVA